MILSIRASKILLKIYIVFVVIGILIQFLIELFPAYLLLLLQKYKNDLRNDQDLESVSQYVKVLLIFLVIFLFSYIYLLYLAAYKNNPKALITCGILETLNIIYMVIMFLISFNYFILPGIVAKMFVIISLSNVYDYSKELKRKKDIESNPPNYSQDNL